MDTKITQEMVKEALDYDTETGLFTWKNDRPLSQFKNLKAKNTYLGRFAGKTAGCEYYMKKCDITYLQIRLMGELFLGHRLACFYTYGFWPDGLVDHIDGNGLNNRLSNLRVVDREVNARNGRLSRNNKSGVNGVYWHAVNEKWIAEGHWTENGTPRKKSLGSYTNLEDAKKARELWEASQGNFTDRHGR